MTALLVTADGEVFRGEAVGAPGVAVGEGVFNTSMTGYQEIVTDPSYSGQIVVLTSAHIGNYGAVEFDDQADVNHAAGLVVRSMSRRASSWRAAGSFRDQLRSRGTVAIAEVDTRRLTRHLRDHGAMPIAIGTDVDEADLRARAASAPSMEGSALALDVGTRSTYRIDAQGERAASVVALDLGMKRSIAHHLARSGLDVTVVPATTTADAIMELGPDGVFVSNGPGDPEPLVGPVATVRDLLGRVPVFGICLGHQVLGLALGAATFKLPFGHHGGNHPVRRMADGVVEITAQNHGFAVDLWSLGERDARSRSALPDDTWLPQRVATGFGDVVPTHQNLNDGTLEGLRCLDVPAWSIQYHPEASPGPHDASWMFGEFAGALG